MRVRSLVSSRFPWREGNRYRLLVDGGEFFPAMLESIAAARRYVLLEMYLFESGRLADRFIDALIGAVGRGVSVHVLIDDLGSYLLRRKDRQRLVEGGVRLVIYNPLRASLWFRNLLRDHRKLLAADGEVAFTGGAGLTDQFDPQLNPDLYGHETMLEIRGPCVQDWEALFVRAWERWGGGTLDLPAKAWPADPRGQGGQLAVHTRALTQSEIMRSVVGRIRQARRRVWLATAYFLPTRKLRVALRRAARAGLDVRLILPGHLTDHPSVRLAGRRYYERLLRHGVRIFEYQPRFLHAKVALCDDWISLGSSNLDRWNHRWCLEANQELDDPRLVREIEELFAADFLQSEEILYPQWRSRPRLGRLVEGVMGRIEAILIHISDWRSRRAGRMKDS